MMRIESKLGQRLFGLVMLILSAGLTVWCWYTVLTEGSYLEPESILASPGLAVIGLGMVIFPLDMQKLRAQHDVDWPRKLAHYPLGWKVLILVALVIALGNWLAMSRYTSESRSGSVSATADSSAGQEGHRRPPDSSEISPRPVRARGILGELWGWFKIGLILGGVFVGVAGMFWHQTAKLAPFFGWELNPDKGIWILLIGFAMAGTGLALIYFGL
jgi:hypothetical protein